MLFVQNDRAIEETMPPESHPTGFIDDDDLLESVGDDSWDNKLRKRADTERHLMRAPYGP